ncbi:MAG: hypothetical protein ACFKPT_22460 [Gloeotrichia echinulata GP01]
MRITSGIDFLPGKNKFWMDDESLGFVDICVVHLTIVCEILEIYAYYTMKCGKSVTSQYL